MDFPHEVRFSAGIGPAHFSADLRNAASSAFEEGAPFMGTALAEHKQCLNALSLLPENLLPQWQQKIANAENNEGRYYD